MNTPTMTPGTVEMVSVPWIMQNAKHSVDGYETINDFGYPEDVDYKELIANKATDSHFGTLVNTIISRGFRVPIVMLEDYSGLGLTHGNGHHRMAAAILLCLDEIPVYWSDAGYMEEHVSSTEELEEEEGEYKNLHLLIDSIYYDD